MKWIEMIVVGGPETYERPRPGEANLVRVFALGCRYCEVRVKSFYLPPTKYLEKCWRHSQLIVLGWTEMEDDKDETRIEETGA